MSHATPIMVEGRVQALSFGSSGLGRLESEVHSGGTWVGNLVYLFEVTKQDNFEVHDVVRFAPGWQEGRPWALRVSRIDVAGERAGAALEMSAALLCEPDAGNELFPLLPTAPPLRSRVSDAISVGSLHVDESHEPSLTPTLHGSLKCPRRGATLLSPLAEASASYPVSLPDLSCRLPSLVHPRPLSRSGIARQADSASSAFVSVHAVAAPWACSSSCCAGGCERAGEGFACRKACGSQPLASTKVTRDESSNSLAESCSENSQKTSSVTHSTCATHYRTNPEPSDHEGVAVSPAHRATRLLEKAMRTWSTQVLDEQRAGYVEALREKLENALSADDQRALRSVLRKIAAALSAPTAQIRPSGVWEHMDHAAVLRMQRALQSKLRRLAAQCLEGLDLEDVRSAPAFSRIALLISQFEAMHGQGVAAAQGGPKWQHLRDMVARAGALAANCDHSLPVLLPPSSTAKASAEDEKCFQALREQAISDETRVPLSHFEKASPSPGVLCCHGSLASTCVKCRGCKHGKVQRHCALCSGCPHGKLRQNCGLRSGCTHGKRRLQCVLCSGCPHGRARACCVQCIGCPHGKMRKNCLLCGACP